MREKLKPCPFCGCQEIDRTCTGFGGSFLECVNCDATIYRSASSPVDVLSQEISDADAINAWNRRVGDK